MFKPGFWINVHEDCKGKGWNCTGPGCIAQTGKTRDSKLPPTQRRALVELRRKLRELPDVPA